MAPSFFGYRDQVASEMKSMGHDVEVVSDRPSETTSFKSLAKMGYRFVETQIDRYATILAELISKGEYDRVIYMGGMSFCFTSEQFDRLRKGSNARFVAYLWDSLENCRRLTRCLSQFDDVLSFEPDDCERYGLKFRPLFFGSEYRRSLSERGDAIEYDACFVGSVHQPSKFEAVRKISTGLREMEMKVFEYLYMPSRSVEILRKATNASYRGVLFTRSSLTSADVASIYAKSTAIIDSPQSGQRGLTMRTLEVVGSGRKLITTNPDVANYDFYCPSNIYISVGGSIPSVSFFKDDYCTLPERVIEQYSIRGFCEVLICQAAHKTEYRRKMS